MLLWSVAADRRACVDDGPALQRAILAAVRQQRGLLLSAGTYMVRAPLVVRCAPLPSKACGAFKMRGEGMQARQPTQDPVN